MSFSIGKERSFLKRTLPAHLQTANCVVCDSVLPLHPRVAEQLDDPYRTCEAVACRMAVSRREAMGEVGFRHYLQLVARQTQHASAVAKTATSRKAAEAQENEAAWSSLHASLPSAPVPEALRLVLPTGPQRTRRLAARRRPRYCAHLRELVAAAGADSGPVPGMATGTATAKPETFAEAALPAHLCALCGGGCCTRGADHAYLSAATIRRYRNAQPELTADEVVAAYLSYLTVKTQAGSCINHTHRGCSLPKEMRSDICNRFSCESLARLQASQRDPEPVQVVLIVRRKQDHWRRAEAGLDNAVNARAVLRENGVQRLRQRVTPTIDID